MAAAGVAIEFFRFGVFHIGMVAGDVVEDVAVYDEEIAPAVVVEIEEAGAETAVENVGLAEAGSDGAVSERAVAVVGVEAIEFEIEMADVEIHAAVVAEIGGVGAHAGFGAAIFAEAGARGVADVSECAVAVIEIEKISLRIVGDENVWPAVVIEIGEDDGEAFAVFVDEAGFGGDVGERAVAIIVIEARRGAGEIVGMAIGTDLRKILVAGAEIAAGDGIVHVVLNVIGD